MAVRLLLYYLASLAAWAEGREVVTGFFDHEKEAWSSRR